VAKEMIVTHPLDTVRKVVVGSSRSGSEMTTLTNSLIPWRPALAGWAFAIVD